MSVILRAGEFVDVHNITDMTTHEKKMHLYENDEFIINGRHYRWDDRRCTLSIYNSSKQEFIFYKFLEANTVNEVLRKVSEM